jgi:PKD domain
MRIWSAALSCLVLGTFAHAQSFTFRPSSIAVVQGGRSVTVEVLNPRGSIMDSVLAPNGLNVIGGEGLFGAFLQVSAEKTLARGEYSVKLKGFLGRKAISGFLKVRVQRANQNPSVAAFAVSSGYAIQGESVTFSARASDPDGDPLTCALDVNGDGKAEYTAKPCTTLTQKHPFNTAGSFQPRLVVTDAFGGKTVAVVPAPDYSGPFKLTVEARGPTFTVNAPEDTQDVLPGDGRCADAAGRCSLRAAVMEANSVRGVGFVEVPRGAYTFTLAGDDDTAQRGDLDITGRVKLTGQGADTTILDAARADRGFDVHPGARLWLSNVTVRNGKPVESNENGGAIRSHTDARQAWLEIVDSVLEDSASDGYGGGVFGAARIRGSVIRRNTAVYNGGGVHGTVELEDSVISGNKSGQGGGVFGERVTLRRSVVVENVARLGGGLSLDGGVLQGVLVRGNRAEDSYGGGLYASGNSIRVTGSVFDANSARVGGGIYQGTYTTLELVNSMFTGNTASERAGGVMSAGNLTAVFSSVLRNAAPSGGGLVVVARSDRVDAFRGVLFAENEAPLGPECLGKLTSSGYNLVQNPADCSFGVAYRNKAGVVTDKVGENPGLQSVADRFFGTLLVPGRSSGAANWVPKADCAMPNGTPLELDLMGGPRLRGAACDIGAVELQP